MEILDYEYRELINQFKAKVRGFFLGTAASWLVVLLIGGGMWGCPRYNVWQQEMQGKAEMARAEQNRQIQIEEAKANLESQKLNSQAEVVRAEGMAKSIEIEDGKLTDKYIQYLWVRNINKTEGQKIYIPTEANLPILEAKEKTK